MRDPAGLDALAASQRSLDVLVNNAGANLVARGEWSPDVFEEAVRINLFGAFRLAVRLKPLLAKNLSEFRRERGNENVAPARVPDTPSEGAPPSTRVSPPL